MMEWCLKDQTHIRVIGDSGPSWEKTDPRPFVKVTMPALLKPKTWI